MTTRDWETLREQMSDVQRRAFDAARAVGADESLWRDTLFQANYDTVATTFSNLVGRHGCGGAQVTVGDKVRSVVRDAARESAGSIANTWNYDLAQAILAIGRQAPRANLRTYRSRLFGDTPNSIHAGFDNWASNRGIQKMAQIWTTETGQAINASTELFYRRNPRLDGQARIIPQAAGCPVCQGLVAGNPYQSARAAYAAGDLPVHPGCVHTVEPGRVLAEDCSEVWRGEDW